MYIKSVEITNYRIFYKNHYFDFGFNQNKSLNIIFGKNSTGKSSLIDAIYWCFYGKEIRERGIEPLCNDEIIEEIGTNDEIPVNVTVIFVNNFDEEIIVRRSVSFYKDKDGKIIHDPDTTFNISKEGFLYSFPDFEMSRICRKDLFDLCYIGENEILFNNDFDINITSILGYYFQLDILNKAEIHLKKSFDNLLRKYKKISPEIFIIEKHKECVNEYEKISQEVDNVNDELFKLRELQMNHHFKIDSENIKQKEILLREYEHVNNKLNNSIKDYNSLVVRSFPMAILVSDLFSNSKTNKFLSDFLSEDKMDSFSQENKVQLKYYLSNLKNEIWGISDYIKMIQDLKNNCLKIADEISAINNWLSNYVDDEWAKENDSIEKSIKFSEYKLATLKHRKKFIEKELSSLNREIKEIQNLSSEFSKKESFYNNAIDNIKFLHEEFSKNILNNISDLMNNLFINDFGMSDKFSNIIIHKNFKFDIVKNSGKHIHFLDLSYSERYIFYLSFIFSIQEIIGKDIFLIIDAQSLNFDEKHWSNFLSLLKNNSNQCFLLFNENMYDEVTRRGLIDNINVEYELINSFKN